MAPTAKSEDLSCILPCQLSTVKDGAPFDEVWGSDILDRCWNPGETDHLKFLFFLSGFPVIGVNGVLKSTTITVWV